MGEITLDQYKGSNIEKGFITDIESPKQINDAVIAKNLVDNFQKGLIDQDLFSKAVDELNMVGGTAEVGSKIVLDSKFSLVKGEEGWEEKVEEEEEEVEKGCKKAEGEDSDEDKDGDGEGDEMEKAEDADSEDDEETDSDEDEDDDKEGEE